MGEQGVGQTNLQVADRGWVEIRISHEFTQPAGGEFTVLKGAVGAMDAEQRRVTVAKDVDRRGGGRDVNGQQLLPKQAIQQRGLASLELADNDHGEKVRG